MTLKERLDAVWQDKRLCCPSNIVAWNEDNRGYHTFSELGLYYTKGKLLAPKYRKVKGKGFSHLWNGKVGNKSSGYNKISYGDVSRHYWNKNASIPFIRNS